MWDDESEKPCVPKSWNLSDDLGQIEYIFSDKTGTLTRNIMEFRKCSIRGRIYGDNGFAPESEGARGARLRKEEQLASMRTADNAGVQQAAEERADQAAYERQKMQVFEDWVRELKRVFEPKYSSLDDSRLTFADPQIFKDLQGLPKNGSSSDGNARDSGIEDLENPAEQATYIREFFSLLAICHTVVVSKVSSTGEDIVEDDIDDDNRSQRSGDDESWAQRSSRDEGASDREDPLSESPSVRSSFNTQRIDDGRLSGMWPHSEPGSVRSSMNTPWLEGRSSGMSPLDNSSGLTDPGLVTPPNPTLLAPIPIPGKRNKAHRLTASSKLQIPKIRLKIKRKRGLSLSSTISKLVPADPTVRIPLNYKAESPDESALVSAARNAGFTFVSRRGPRFTVDILGSEYEFETLQVIEFNSTRKRMSVIARRPAPWNDIVLFCKGADNVIMERLQPGQEVLVDKTSQDIAGFSNEGLRTLTLGYRVIPQQEYDQWTERFKAASTSLEDRAEKIDAVYEEVEKDLMLLGATAIEDKLQEGVPHAIELLRKAGIKVWVLTGDKLETAINIGFASNLLDREMNIWTVRGGEGKDETLMEFDKIVEGILDVESGKKPTSYETLPADNGDLSEEEVPTTSQESPADKQQRKTASELRRQRSSLLPTRLVTENGTPIQNALVIDGGALKHLLESPEAREKILEVSLVCKSVICCRTSPLQKALVVELVRRGHNAVCLAIGDGANDVSMIQAANVGVGISGQEGVQASMAADYAIGQFRFLAKLLLVHGHWSYQRIAEMTLNFFYKNVVWTFPSLWYQFYCAFSANIFYDYTYLQLYNLILTLMPVCVIGTLYYEF
ncbi:hypothetical protein BC936DRAFT_148374 [Jimgerdemannia flammicorona]|uniref:Phospholipid-transporting ATPase n=1 Tax=Jimgerdemannia flammicorona TaxID=994334 RepID=A0A433D369_9FUNG|nr:hypothetical protein BC936DRAFT_148374 [Jimgerdemannia flammicorona]